MDISKILIDQKANFQDTQALVSRSVLDHFQPYLKYKQSILVSGVRRCGKSSLLKLIYQRHYKGQPFFYINFDDERLAHIRLADLSRIYEEVLAQSAPVKPIVAFLDEIQEITGWEKWVNRLSEMEHIKVYVTGSNASLLSGEMASSLTGRYLPINLRPFSFTEVLGLSGIKASTGGTAGQAQIRKHFAEYLNFGGFPEIVNSKSLLVAQEYYANILHRDIASRLKLRKTQTLRNMAQFVLSHSSCLHTYRQLAKGFELKSDHTAEKYIASLENAFIIERSPLWSRSLKQQIRNPFKIYAIDPVFARAVSVSGDEMLGRLLETIVYGECRRRGHQTYYWKNPSAEVDIYLADQKQLIQVSYTVQHAGTRQREISSLIKGMEQLKIKSGLILTNSDPTESIQVGTHRIKILPAWQWCLQG